MNRLVYTTPSITSLFNGLSMSSFESYDLISMYVHVTPASTGIPLTCSDRNHNCRVKYGWNYTPIIYHMIPSTVYPGMPAAVAMNAMSCPNYKHEDQMPVDIRIDGTSFNLTDYYDIDSTLSTNSLIYVPGVAQTVQRNATGEVTAFFRGAGYAMNDTSTIETCLFDGVTCYRAKVLPSLTAISHNTGFAEGG